ncbi:hypothetical protein HDV00_010460 [Rhizophlyctis rosea]|nr:hypothetical protein HDV00_010460 [Rhizophlyctis rosea]
MADTSESHRRPSVFEDSIMRDLLQNRIDPIEDATNPQEKDLEKERLERMYVMLRHSKKYRKAQVENANAKWNSDDSDYDSPDDTASTLSSSSVPERRATLSKTPKRIAFADDSTDIPSRPPSLKYANTTAPVDWDASTPQDHYPAAMAAEEHSRTNSVTSSHDSGKRGVQFDVQGSEEGGGGGEAVGVRKGGKWAGVRRKSVDALYKWTHQLKRALPSH